MKGWVNYEGVGKCCFAVMEIAIVDTGAVQRKVSRHDERPHMPSWCVALRDFRRAQLYSGPIPYQRDSPQCVVCVAMRQQGLTVDAQFDVYKCSECAQRWHLECAGFLLEESVEESPFSCPICRGCSMEA